MIIKGDKNYNFRDYRTSYGSTLSDVALYPDSTVIAHNQSHKTLYYYFMINIVADTVGGFYSDGFKFDNHIGLYKRDFTNPPSLQLDNYTGVHHISEGAKYLNYDMALAGRTHKFNQYGNNLTAVSGGAILPISGISQSDLKNIWGVCLDDSIGESNDFPNYAVAVFSLKASQAIMADRFTLLKQAGTELRKYDMRFQSDCFENYQDFLDFIG